MSQIKVIKIESLSVHYQVDSSFFQQLNDMGVIEIHTVDSSPCVDEQYLALVDKVVRLHQDLEINPQGLDVVMNLLNKIESLERSLVETQNRLSIFE